MVSMQARRDQARYAIDRGMTHRRACALLSISRCSFYYIPKMPETQGVRPATKDKKLLSLPAQEPDKVHEDAKCLLSGV